jgi:hypothetical protein
MRRDQDYSQLVKTFDGIRVILSIMQDTLNARIPALTRTQWLIFFAAGIGFAFDMYEMVVQTVVVRPILMELGPYQPGTPDFNRGAGIMLFLPTMVGGMGAAARSSSAIWQPDWPLPMMRIAPGGS